MTATQLSQLRVLGWSQLSTEITGYNKHKHKLGLSRADIDEIDNDPRDFYSAQGLKWKNKVSILTIHRNCQLLWSISGKLLKRLRTERQFVAFTKLVSSI